MFQDRSDSAANPFLRQSSSLRPRAVLPSVSMLPASVSDPNYIPVGGFGRLQHSEKDSLKESETRNNFIPFGQAEPRQASIPLALRADPRIDIDGPVEQVPTQFIRYIKH